MQRALRVLDIWDLYTCIICEYIQTARLNCIQWNVTFFGLLFYDRIILLLLLLLYMMKSQNPACYNNNSSSKKQEKKCITLS